MNTKIMKEFRRTSIALAIFFNLVSGGFYSVYWLQRKTAFLSSKLPQNKLPIFLFVACYLLLLLFWTHSPAYSILYFVVKIILLFDVRERIHKAIGAKEGSHYWFSAVWVFAFGFLYMIYKIDQFPADKNTPDNPEIHPA